MRELKFRRHTDYANDFIYYDLINSSEDDKIIFNIEKMPIEQYTGLKDKNGKEIYEGDILREKGLLSLTCVEWDKNNTRYLTRVLDKSKHLSSIFYFDIIAGLECEVIGNIHDNPELFNLAEDY